MEKLLESQLKILLMQIVPGRMLYFKFNLKIKIMNMGKCLL